jgi:hypothetical protein
MKTTSRYRRSLPSPILVVLLLLAVTAFCVINWRLLKAANPVQPKTKSFESLILEEMLKEMVPVYISVDRSLSSDAQNFGASGSHNLDPEYWMRNYADFSLSGMESELTVEDWMISTATWTAK